MKKAQDVTLTDKNLDIGVLGENVPFTKLSEEEIKKYLNTGMIIDS